MLDGIWNTITSPLSLLRGVVNGTVGNISSIISGGFGSAVGGAVFGVGVGALATMFAGDIGNFLRGAGKAEWANALAQYVRANSFSTMMMHAGLAGAAAGGALGGGTALANSVQSGFTAVPEQNDDPSRNGARAVAQAQNVGHSLGSVAVVGAVALAGAGLYKHFTGTAGQQAGASAATPKPNDLSRVDVPTLPAGKLPSSEVTAAPTRPPEGVAVQNAQVSMGAVRH